MAQIKVKQPLNELVKDLVDVQGALARLAVEYKIDATKTKEKETIDARLALSDIFDAKARAYTEIIDKLKEV